MKLKLSCLLSSLLLLSCGEDISPLTQLVLVADSDIVELDRVVFEVSSSELGSRSAEANRVGLAEPSYLAVVHETGGLGPITVSARGLRDGNVVVQRTQRVFFVEEQTRLVPLHLLASCVGVVCASNQTCGEAGCVSQVLGEEQLPTWSGQPPRAQPAVPRDAGIPDAGELDGGDTPMEAGTSDAGLDASREGGTQAAEDAAIDAALPRDDAGPRDAGPRDAGPRDGGSDARVGDAAQPLTQCAPIPAPAVDLSSDINHCGTCTRMCKPGENCVTGACVKK